MLGACQEYFFFFIFASYEPLTCMHWEYLGYSDMCQAIILHKPSSQERFFQTYFPKGRFFQTPSGLSILMVI